MDHGHQTSSAYQPAQRSVLAALGLIVGFGMLLAIVVGMVGGKMHDWKAGVSMLILWSIPIGTLGTGLALGSLVWRKENKHLAQIALWVNGMLALFGFPILIYWLLGMN